MSFYLLDHPNRYGPHYYTERWVCQHGISGPHLIVIHTAETLADLNPPDLGAENVARYGATTDRSVSWHSTVDSDSTIPMLPDTYTAFHVKGFNRCGLGLEIATQARDWPVTPAWWDEAAYERAGRVVADWCLRWSIPPRLLDGLAVGRGESGIVAHSTLDPTRRGDPGAGFDWNKLLAYVEVFMHFTDSEIARLKAIAASYEDSSPDPWAQAAWSAAVAEGVLSGRPQAPLARQELALILMRLGLIGDREVSAWAKPARDLLYDFGVTDGTHPGRPATAERVWTMLARVIDTLGDPQ